MRTHIAAVSIVGLCLAFPVLGGNRTGFQSESGAKPNFSGAWRPDPAQATHKTTPKDSTQKNLSPPPAPDDDDDDSGPVSITVFHKEPSLSIMTTSGGAEDVSVMNLTTDGRENTNPLDEGITHKSKSHWDGEKLVTEWTIEQYGATVAKGTETRYLAADGKTMILDTRLETDRDITESHQVFVRKAK